MAYSMYCRDTGTDCPGNFQAETREQLLAELIDHYEREHPNQQITEQRREELQRIAQQAA